MCEFGWYFGIRDTGRSARGLSPEVMKVWILLVIVLSSFRFTLKKYSNHLNTGLVWYSDGYCIGLGLTAVLPANKFKFKFVLVTFNSY